MITGIWKSRVIVFSFAKYNTKLDFKFIAAITDTGVQVSIFDIVSSTYVYVYGHICLRISICIWICIYLYHLYMYVYSSLYGGDIGAYTRALTAGYQL